MRDNAVLGEGNERDHLLTTQEAAAYLRRSPGTLRNDRHKRRGPRYIKNGRQVLYRRADLAMWIDQHTVTVD